MSNIKYNRTTTTTLKVAGILDVANGVIDIDGEQRSLLAMMSDFEGAPVDITVKVKVDDELEVPVEE